jgi:hypothetical protein
VVFKSHVHAQVALSNAGKLEAFGKDLVSFQLSRDLLHQTWNRLLLKLELQ